ncbi:MAG: hypothetical protein ACOCW1_04985 [Chitinispirillaceae bacterium]
MLRFANKPDEVFTQMISDALDLVIDQIGLDIELKEENGFALIYFGEKLVNSFGGARDGVPIILNELKKLRQAHHSDDIYMPGDLHFKLLDRILRTYCELYNDEFHRNEECVLKCNGENIQKLSYDDIFGIFFWDKDFDFNEETASALLNNSQLRNCIDSSISIQALNTSLGIPVDYSDLKLEKWEGEPEWSDTEDFSDFWLDREEDLEC